LRHCALDDRDPVKRFHGCKNDETIHSADEAISLSREDILKRMAGINAPDQTTGSDHVGHHHSPDLPPVVQEIPGRRAEAEGVGSPVGLGAGRTDIAF
jgi:hypothetical protein